MTLLEIFDVEHGQCSLLTSSAGERMLIDCGHNSSTGWRPSAHLRQLGVGWLEDLVITNYDEDHASDLPALRQTVSVGVLARNPTVTGADLFHLKAHGGMGRGIAALSNMTGGFTEAVTHPAFYDGMTTQFFWNSYPHDFDDENNLSLVMVLRWPRFSICYTGDIERAGWLRLLQRPDFRAAMQNITVFMASHHGRRNGYCEELFTWTGMNPEIIVVSDSGKQYETQETGPLYRCHARGIHFNGRQRRVFTTRNDGVIWFEIGAGNGALIYTSR